METDGDIRQRLLEFVGQSHHPAVMWSRFCPPARI